MNAVRSYTHTTSSGFLILYGLFVLPWIEATYAAILPVLVSVLLILLVGQSRPGQHPALADKLKALDGLPTFMICCYWQ